MNQQAPLTPEMREYLDKDPSGHMWKLYNDTACIGTKEYQGYAYFWQHEYKHFLRDCTRAQRKRVHNTWLKEGLLLDGISSNHMEIVQEIVCKIPRKNPKFVKIKH
jgi:hypothetical protein